VVLTNINSGGFEARMLGGFKLIICGGFLIRITGGFHQNMHHRLCVVYLYDEDAFIPCKIV
jgi:hypothetical protein